MRAALSQQKPKYPQAWDDISQGQLIKEELTLACEPLVARIFGYHFVRLGSLSSSIPLNNSPIKHIVNLTEPESSFSDVRGVSSDLPLQNSSVDGFLLAAELDFAQDPHQILREVDRAITANGQVIIAGFNPFSVAGILKYFPVNKGNLLHQGRFFTANRIKDWLQLLGFEIIETEYIMYSSLFAGKRWHQGSRLQSFCKRYLPMLSSMYVIVARKREIPLSTIKPKWKVKKPRFATANARVGHSKVRTR
ncbi:SAM-dependent methyltransferase [Glaciecola sp. MH2013]|uniref:methyltransferase domain-containing protein n=1 Tax=Glaciecola sp. MH2013 TaxID=2785524 RepID=UPI00189C6EA2|nr:methyltransferase domain-containing protein [Glaciecola sp. MH2013]MBF7073098.1 SAM-dependent methyltransferase [Glaciecola sp. MH2013]